MGLKQIAILCIIGAILTLAFNLVVALAVVVLYLGVDYIWRTHKVELNKTSSGIEISWDEEDEFGRKTRKKKFINY